MTESIELGNEVRFKATYKDADGAITDPSNPKITIYDENNAIKVDGATPNKVEDGIYYYDYEPDSVGNWLVKWEGEISTLDTIEKVRFIITHTI